MSKKEEIVIETPEKKAIAINKNIIVTVAASIIAVGAGLLISRLRRLPEPEEIVIEEIPAA